MKCLLTEFKNQNCEDVFMFCGYGCCYSCKHLENQIDKYKYDTVKKDKGDINE